MYILDVTMGNGERNTVLVVVAGDEMTLIENRGRRPPEWLKQEILGRIAKRSNGGVEQA